MTVAAVALPLACHFHPTRDAYQQPARGSERALRLRLRGENAALVARRRDMRAPLNGKEPFETWESIH